MKVLVLMTSLLFLGTSALPEPELDAIYDGQFTYRGGDLPRGDGKNLALLSDLERLQRQCSCWRCWPEGHSCPPYKCRCGGADGCYSCNGGPYVCQKGPGSGQCLGGTA
ncbi:hypothetical protein E4U55_002124 [Claviceps digitariae]|nr:hypothetical protein E4U55_002124 [Claviceps digitariae]